MVTGRVLGEKEIENILLQTEDEEDYVLGEASDKEPDEIIQDDELEEPLLSSSNASPITVLSVPDVLYGRGKKKQRNSDKFVWYGSHPRSSRTPQRNIILHPLGNKGPAKCVVTAVDSWQLFFTDGLLNKIVTNTNQEISEQRKKYIAHVRLMMMILFRRADDLHLFETRLLQN